MAEDKKKLEEVAAAAPKLPGAYESKWTDKMDSTLDKILNREKFDYDMNADALYNQYKDRYVQGGQMASQDAMGQAAALTGGYGNSYAQGVATQAYQNWLSRLNDKVPELQRGALDRYKLEGNQLLNQYNLYGQREAQDRQRWDADRKNNYQHIMSLMQNTGYNPTDDELAGAGITRPQADAILRVIYMNNPMLDPNYVAPASGGDGYYGPWSDDKKSRKEFDPRGMNNILSGINNAGSKNQLASAIESASKVRHLMSPEQQEIIQNAINKRTGG